MAGINCGILSNAYPLSSEAIKELENKAIETNQVFAYLDEDSKLCFTGGNLSPDGIKDLAWHNAYELSNEEGTFTKKAYAKTGLKTFEQTATFVKQTLDDIWVKLLKTFKLGDTIEEDGLLYTYMGMTTLDEAKEAYKPQLEAMSGMTWEEIVAQIGGGDEESVWEQLGMTEETFVPVEPSWAVCAASADVAGDIVIANEMYEYPVTAFTLQDNVEYVQAFENCPNITSIVIPDSITVIPAGAFRGCTGLQSVTIPEGITQICFEAFKNCSSLTDIIIPNSVINIENNVLSGCSALESITIPFIGSDPAATRYNALFGYIFGSSSFEGSVNAIQQYDHVNGRDITWTWQIPEKLSNVTFTGAVIPNWAFNGCTTIKNITLRGVNSIGSYAFRGCTALNSAILPDSVTFIGRGAFYACTALTQVTIPSGLTTIETNTFASTAITSINTSNVTSIGDLAFSDCKALDSIYISAGVSTISGTAFAGTDIKNIEASASNSVYYSSENCLIEKANKKLILGSSTSIIPTDIVSIGSSAFSSNDQLTSVVIPANIEEIDGFGNCSNLNTVTFAENSHCISIADSAFSGCRSLSSINIPSSVTTIGPYAFNYTTVSEVHINDIASWCNISFSCQQSNPCYNGGDLYLNNTLITELIIPDSLSKISSYAFCNSNTITAITIPASITTIDYNALYGCIGINSITFTGTTTQWDSIVKGSNWNFKVPATYVQCSDGQVAL